MTKRNRVMIRLASVAAVAAVWYLIVLALAQVANLGGTEISVGYLILLVAEVLVWRRVTRWLDSRSSISAPHTNGSVVVSH